MMSSLTRLATVAVFAAAAGAAQAQTAPSTPAPATPAAETPICTDRPTKANVPCAVPQGSWQLEADGVNWTRSVGGGVTSDVTLFTNPTLKYGVTKTLDLELNVAPWEQVRTRAAGQTTTQSSVGDVYARAKWAAYASDAVSLSVIPYVKLPTASHQVGNGRVEGGLIAPLSIALPAKFTLVLGPEVDVLENAALNGTHANLINLVNISRSVGKWTFYGELWNDQNFDPRGHVSQSTADVAVTYLLTNTLQLDAGANFGVNRAAPRQQLYLGVSQRF